MFLFHKQSLFSLFLLYARTISEVKVKKIYSKVYLRRMCNLLFIYSDKYFFVVCFYYISNILIAAVSDFKCVSVNYFIKFIITFFSKVFINQIKKYLSNIIFYCFIIGQVVPYYFPFSDLLFLFFNICFFFRFFIWYFWFVV